MNIKNPLAAVDAGVIIKARIVVNVYCKLKEQYMYCARDTQLGTIQVIHSFGPPCTERLSSVQGDRNSREWQFLGP